MSDKPDSIFYPGEIGVLTRNELESYRKDSVSEDEKPTSYLKTGIRPLDDAMSLLRAGRLVPICGYTSNFKSGLMKIIENNAVEQINTEHGDIIAHVSWEDSVESSGIRDVSTITKISMEDLDAGNVSDLQWKSVLDTVLKQGSRPIFWIGHSDSALRSGRKRMNLMQVWDCLNFLVENGKRIRLLGLDYLQRIPVASNMEGFRVGMMNNVDISKDMTGAFKCPSLLGTQAKREVLDRKVKLPEIRDSQETSNMEQSSDMFLSTWMPWKTEAVKGDTTVEFNGRSYPLTDNLLLYGLLKDKWRSAPKFFASLIDFENFKLEDVPASQIGRVDHKDLNKYQDW